MQKAFRRVSEIFSDLIFFAVIYILDYIDLNGLEREQLGKKKEKK